ncbi:hypothetical protein TSMEX_005768 [Taenia solium]|eukprot:TsM_000680400 transcript=TsM_000680400 gene=TsM_000680400
MVFGANLWLLLFDWLWTLPNLYDSFENHCHFLLAADPHHIDIIASTAHRENAGSTTMGIFGVSSLDLVSSAIDISTNLQFRQL